MRGSPGRPLRCPLLLLCTTSGCPSVSIRRSASTSRGSPMFTWSSTQLMVTESINSSVEGIIFREIIADTVRAASKTSS